MCGFAGVVAWDERYRVDRPTLQRMAAAVAHRGPDGEGLFLNHGDGGDRAPITPARPQCGLAFRRLAVLDPDPCSDQPFTDGRRTLVFNGEVYNFRELRAELSRDFPNYEWRTSGDTEVLLRAHACWGDRCVEKLNGMFAFAVWDEQEKTLFLARDRMGQKPLYVAYLGDDGSPAAELDCHVDDLAPPAAVAFASELPALRELHWPDWTIDAHALRVYLQVGYVPPELSIYSGVKTLPPRQLMRVGGRGAGLLTYDDERDGDRSPWSDFDAVATTRRVVTNAVRRRLVADVPLGCFLSGGVDSAVIAAAMRGAASEVRTFSIGFDDPRYDESEHAAAVARHLGTKHHRFVVTPDAADDLPKLAAVFGEPFADSSALPTHYLARETRRHVTVALSGDGGDELFCGYDRYRAMRLGERLARVPRWMLRDLPLFVLEQLPPSHPKSVAQRARRFLRTADLPAAERYESYMRLFDELTIDRLLPGDSPYRPSTSPGLADLFGAIHTRCDAVRTAMAVDKVTYLPADLLTKVDRASMLHALEVRSPFMDPDVVTFAAGLTTDQLLKGGPKRMLREAFAADLPAWVFTRRKMGFAVPVGEWFRGPLRAMLRDHLFAADSFAAGHFNTPVVRRLVDDHESGRADHGQRLYALLMLELWWRGAKGG